MEAGSEGEGGYCWLEKGEGGYCWPASTNTAQVKGTLEREEPGSPK